jgi:CO/xanthine dehydrogenase Mo-binding subunit
LAEHQFKGRREDQRLVTGRARYTNDHHLHGQAAAHFLRADRAHARIVRIDTAEARKSKGVLDVVTGEDIVAAAGRPRRCCRSSRASAAKAIARFQAYIRYKDFKTFHIEQTKAFKRDLADQRGQRTFSTRQNTRAPCLTLVK